MGELRCRPGDVGDGRDERPDEVDRPVQHRLDQPRNQDDLGGDQCPQWAGIGVAGGALGEVHPGGHRRPVVVHGSGAQPPREPNRRVVLRQDVPGDGADAHLAGPSREPAQQQRAQAAPLPGIGGRGVSVQPLALAMILSVARVSVSTGPVTRIGDVPGPQVRRRGVGQGHPVAAA